MEPASWSTRLQTCRSCATSRRDASARAWRRRRHRSRLRRASGHHRGDGRRSAVQRVRPAHRLDDLHRHQSVPRDPRREARRRDRCRRRSVKLNVQTSSGKPTPLTAIATFRSRRAPLQINRRRAVSGGDDWLRHRAGRGAGPRGRRDPRGGAARSHCRRSDDARLFSARRNAFQASLQNELG